MWTIPEEIRICRNPHKYLIATLFLSALLLVFLHTIAFAVDCGTSEKLRNRQAAVPAGPVPLFRLFSDDGSVV